MTDSFNLFGFQISSSEDDIKALRKRELKNLLTSYGDEADIFTEVIQNAYDAVVRAYDEGLYGPNETPEITIVIGKRATGDRHYLLVSENGTGMPPSVARQFTVPGFSANKKLGSTVGHKGVGASFFAAASNRFGVVTIDDDGLRTEAEIRGAYDWITGESAPNPQVFEKLDLPHRLHEFLPAKRGTAVYYEFHPGLKPATLSHIVLKDSDNPQRELERWATFFCFKTPIGQIEPPSDDNSPVKVGIALDDGTDLYRSDWTIVDYDLAARTLGYPYPSRILKIATDVQTIDSMPEAQRVWRNKGRHQALRLVWHGSDVEKELSIHHDFTEDERLIFDQHFQFITVFFAYSTDILKEIHKRVGTRAQVFKYGIRIGSDGVAQGRMLDFDLTSNTGLNRQAHAVVAFKRLELDVGRKIASSEAVTEVIRKIARRAMTVLAEYRWALKKKELSDPSYDLDSWRQQTKDRTSDSLIRVFYKTLAKPAALEVDPNSENDVIALFSALIEAQVIKGYRIQALSGFNRYDGLIHINRDDPSFQKIDDPLSVRSEEWGSSGDYQVVEFKLQFDSLLEDFENKIKAPKDIKLLICWNLPDINVPRGHIQYTYGERRDFRSLYGMTHVWEDENASSYIPIISLKHLVAEKLASLEVGSPGIGTARLKDLESLDSEMAL
ncbi:hypothetical protein SADO_15034 [Salinisphaera dokdonensis CL-ES53]|uniref:Uncharacterized protein n=1 Tax=Salinisphaera dokdonensis CL-ES53 TaxID=1304272 RepID=A0ABV2B3V6_9GAMM